MKYSMFLLFLLLLTLACQNENADEYFSNCRYGKPKAIFSGSIPGIEGHDFRIKSLKGIEEVNFSDGVELTIIQSGCDSIRQDFQFTLPGNYEKEEAIFWVTKAVEEFQRLSRLGPDYLVFSSWAQSINARAETIQLGISEEIQPGFYVRVDAVPSSGDAILMVTLSESP